MRLCYHDLSKPTVGSYGLKAVRLAATRANATGKSALSVRTWLKQGGPQPRWWIVFPALGKSVMPQWVRAKAWALMQGAVTWGEDLAAFAPERSCCRFCVLRGHSVAVDSADHFPCCPLHEALWVVVRDLLADMGFPPVVRRWFVLYGPESMRAPRGKYQVALWVWATMVAVMLLARSSYTRAGERGMRPQVAVAVFRVTLADICRMDCAVTEAAQWAHRWYGFASRSPAGIQFSYG